MEWIYVQHIDLSITSQNILLLAETQLSNDVLASPLFISNCISTHDSGSKVVLVLIPTSTHLLHVSRTLSLHTLMLFDSRSVFLIPLFPLCFAYCFPDSTNFISFFDYLNSCHETDILSSARRDPLPQGFQLLPQGMVEFLPYRYWRDWSSHFLCSHWFFFNNFFYTNNQMHSYTNDSTLHSSTSFQSDLSFLSQAASHLDTASSINSLLNRISQWSTWNLVKFDASKIQFLPISNENSWQLSFDSSVIPPFDSVKVLGFTATSTLSWKPHVTGCLV